MMNQSKPHIDQILAAGLLSVFLIACLLGIFPLQASLSGGILMGIVGYICWRTAFRQPASPMIPSEFTEVRDFFIQMDHQGQILWANDSAKRLMNLPFDTHTCYFSESISAGARELPHVLQHGHGQFWAKHHTPQDHSVYVEWKFHGNGKVRYGIGRDITAHKHEISRLEEEKALAWDRCDSHMQHLSTMSHEIRTPLHAIAGLSDILLNEPHLDNQYPHLAALQHAGSHLLKLLNDILMESKLEAGKVQLAQAPMSLEKISQTSMAIFSNLAQSKGVDLVRSFDDDVPEWVIGDETKLSQIVHNLLGNALKFTHHGSVKLYAHVLRKTKWEAYLKIGIKDTGIGIPKEKQSAILEAFSQASLETERRYGGTGLGLTISSKLLDLMGSKLLVQSKEGEGSDFYFILELPLSVTPANEVNIEGRTMSKQSKILLAEDNPINALIIRKLLGRMGLSCITVDNGEQAAEIVHHTEFDLVLMDLQMPVMDGFGANRAIRADFPDLPVIALTAESDDRIRKQVAQSGMVDFATKPINYRQLKNLLLKHLPKKNHPADLSSLVVKA
ncbi:response regulator [Pontibacter sp. G13]|uniref:response regulator n=1 Tax=Pontibacter sp. G13 TaxID=3074898 RepID=UPI00288A6DC3|nr:response regulator [Pontibacter sp. G13]WNJ16945.1 response regulator [Pontibacter sp. G13]